jgi:guanylate kinase
MFVLSAPSGTGKTTLISGLLSSRLKGLGGIAFSVSHTTRQPRRGEVDGRDYHFIDRTTFKKMIDEDQFLEWAEVFGDYKGTSLREVEPRLAKGLDVILDLDVQGGVKVLESNLDATGIFILPPSRGDLERRLRTRGLDDPSQIAKRLAVSLWEIRRYEYYDYVIINDDLEGASEALATVILDKQYRRECMEEQVQLVLADFERESVEP